MTKKTAKVSSKKPVKAKIAVGCGKVMESRRKVTKYFQEKIMPGLTRRRNAIREGIDWSKSDSYVLSYKKGGVVKKGKKKSKPGGY